MGNRSLEGGQPKKSMGNLKNKTGFPNRQISKKVIAKHCTDAHGTLIHTFKLNADEKPLNLCESFC